VLWRIIRVGPGLSRDVWRLAKAWEVHGSRRGLALGIDPLQGKKKPLKKNSCNGSFIFCAGK
jgi:hypothetical protein